MYKKKIRADMLLPINLVIFLHNVSYRTGNEEPLKNRRPVLSGAVKERSVG